MGHGNRRAWAVVFLMALAARASEADVITLKGEAYVKGPTVTLGEIADVEGVNAQTLLAVEVGPAAIPGGARRLNAALLASRIRDAGIDTSNIEFRGSPRVLATTRHLEITGAMLAEDLRNFVFLEMPWDPANAQVDIFSPPQGVKVSDGEVKITWRPNPQFEYLGQGVFRGDIYVDGTLEKSVHCKAHLEAYADVVVASTHVSRKDRLGSHNLRLVKRPLSTLESGAYLRIENLDGFVAKTNLFPNQVVTKRKVTLPNIVKRNQIVVVKTTIGHMTIQTRARALSDGAAGDLISCVSLGSKEEYFGVIDAEGVVHVE